VGLRILLASDHYPPFIGGAHRQTQLLAHELHKRGHCVSVATVWHGGLPEEKDENGVRVYRLKQVRTVLSALARDSQQRHQPPFPDPMTTFKLSGLIQRLKPDIIHSHGWFTYSVAAALDGKDIPLLISARDYGYACANRTLLRGDQVCSGPELFKCLKCSAAFYGAPTGWLAALGVRANRSLLLRKVNGIHSISTYVQQMMDRDFLGDLSATERGIVQTVIPSFREDDEMDIQPLAPEQEPYLLQLPAEPFILFVGALRKVKGVVNLLAAYEQLKTAVPMVMIGTVEQDTPRVFPPGVSVLRNFPHPAVMAAWDRCLFGVLPSLWPEPLGSVVYEGMSRGKAVIGTTPGGHTDMIVDGETGFLVPSGQVEALAGAMQSLISQPDLRQRFGQAGRARATLFTAEVVVPQFEQLYQQLVAESTQRANENNF
jgi:glycosyltransferase involved in cell wall biosynthesis